MAGWKCTQVVSYSKAILVLLKNSFWATSLRLFLKICLKFCHFEPSVAHKSVAYKENVYLFRKDEDENVRKCELPRWPTKEIQRSMQRAVAETRHPVWWKQGEFLAKKTVHLSIFKIICPRVGGPGWGTANDQGRLIIFSEQWIHDGYSWRRISQRF